MQRDFLDERPTQPADCPAMNTHPISTFAAIVVTALMMPTGPVQRDRHERRLPRRQHRRRADGARQVCADLGFAEAIPVSGMVSRGEVRHLGTLGAAMRTGGRRLVRAVDVFYQHRAIPVSSRALRFAEGFRVQGRHPRMEGPELGPGQVAGALQARRGAILHGSGQSP